MADWESAALTLGVGVSPVAGDAVLREMLLTRFKATIERIQQNQDELNRMCDVQVESMRLLGASWEVIGQALGISKQAAAKKYGHLDQAIKSLGLQVPDGSDSA